MKIFIDSADLDQIREAFSWGIVDGITTNPSLIKKAVEKTKASGENVSLEDYICRVLETRRRRSGEPRGDRHDRGGDDRAGPLPLPQLQPRRAQRRRQDPGEPGLRAERTRRRWDGLKSIRTLASEGIPINTTLIFTPEQAMLAAKAGAAYVSPFAGRIDDDLRKKAGARAARTTTSRRAAIEKDGKPVTDGGIASGVQLVEEIVALFAQLPLRVRGPRGEPPPSAPGARVRARRRRHLDDSVRGAARDARAPQDRRGHEGLRGRRRARVLEPVQEGEALTDDAPPAADRAGARRETGTRSRISSRARSPRRSTRRSTSSAMRPRRPRRPRRRSSRS